MQEDNKLSEFLDYMEKLKNYERVGVPKGAGTESDDGFDLGRMWRLLQRLGNPQTNFQVYDSLSLYHKDVIISSFFIIVSSTVYSEILFAKN